MAPPPTLASVTQVLPPALRSISYPVRVGGFPIHVKSISLAEAMVAVSPVGAAGQAAVVTVAKFEGGEQVEKSLHAADAETVRRSWAETLVRDGVAEGTRRDRVDHLPFAVDKLFDAHRVFVGVIVLPCEADLAGAYAVHYQVRRRPDGTGSGRDRNCVNAQHPGRDRRDGSAGGAAATALTHRTHGGIAEMGAAGAPLARRFRGGVALASTLSLGMVILLLRQVGRNRPRVPDGKQKGLAAGATSGDGPF